MASNDNFGMTPETSKFIVLLIVLGGFVIGTGIWTVIGAIGGGLYALYAHSWVPVLQGAGIGAIVGFVICLWSFLKGYIRGTIANLVAAKAAKA